MANNILSSFLVIALSGLLLFSCNAVPSRTFHHKQVKDFCVAKLAQPAEKYQGYLDYACGKFDCSAIQPSGPCFRPNTLVSHASYILDVVYKATGDCYADIGVKTTFDRSYDDCHYP